MGFPNQFIDAFILLINPFYSRVFNHTQANGICWSDNWCHENEAEFSSIGNYFLFLLLPFNTFIIFTIELKFDWKWSIIIVCLATILEVLQANSIALCFLFLSLSFLDFVLGLDATFRHKFSNIFRINKMCFANKRQHNSDTQRARKRKK